MQIALGRKNEEGQGLSESVKAGKVGIATVHDIEGTGFNGQQIQGGHIRYLAPGNMHKTRDIAAQIDQGVELDSALATAKLSPGKQRQAEIDGGGIEGVNGLF